MKLTRNHVVMAPLSVLLCFQAALAQQPPAVFTIGIVQGDGAVNYVNHKPVQVPVVKVADLSGRALPGVKVKFQAPESGPSATFHGALTYSAITGADGTAKAAGFMPNSQPGLFKVNVVAEYEGGTAEEQVSQNNVAPPAAKANHHHLALKILIGSAAVVGFGYIMYEEFLNKNKPYGQR
jgi:hypothetical protein